MSLYQIDRPRNVSFVGKFKFNYFCTIRGRNSPDTPRTIVPVLSFPTIANVGFDAYQNEFKAGLTIGQLESGVYAYSQENNRKVYLALFFSLDAPGGQIEDDPVVFEVIDFDNFRDEDKTTSGTVEGYVYYGAVMNEFVDIQEYYSSKDYFIVSPVCPDNENQYWYQEELNEKTVRHWPKYTTINWFESPDPTQKARMGIYVNIINEKGKTFTLNKSFVRNAPLFDFDYVFRKTLLAYSGPTANNGYISISSNVPLSGEVENFRVSTSSASCDTENFSVSPLTSDIYYGYKSSVKIDLLTDAARKVTFESAITDWDLPHTDELTAYIVGFNSTGELLYYNNPGSGKRVPYAKPSYETVKTKSGIIGAKDQTYRFYNGSISAHSDKLFLGLPDETDTKSTYFDNRQKWIYGMIDGQSEKFDDLESPPKDYDFPQYWVRSADGCKDINEYNRLRTLDETDLPSGYLSIPIPLKGWKFNAMTLQQSKDYILKSNGAEIGLGLTNSLSFLGTKGQPFYYGSENLSGYRYLKFDIASKNNDSQTTSFTINETSKGFTLFDNTENIVEKSWKLDIPANKGKLTFVIDLCNPDNKSDYVDNQDSPYPRLNTYTTSKPQSTDPICLLAAENKPKDYFLITKSLSGNASKNWIDDNLKEKIKSSGIIYLSDDVTKNVDYFEVNTTAFPKAGVGTNIIFGRPRIRNGKIKLAKYFNSDDSFIRNNVGDIIGRNLDYFKEIEIYIQQNDITKDKSIDELLLKDTSGKYSEEFEIYDYDPGYPDETDVIGQTSAQFVDGNQYIFVNPIKIFNQNYNLPYDAVIIEDSKKRKSYKFIEYINSDNTYITIQAPANFDANIIFALGSSIRLGFLDEKTDDRFSSIILKFNKIDKISNNRYKAFIEYSKLDKNSPPNYDGIPEKINGVTTYFSANAPVITVNPPRLVEFNFPVDTLLFTQIKTKPLSGNEVNAIDDYPQDEASNGPYFGVSRIAKIESSNSLVEFQNLKLIRQNSLSNFVYSGNNTTFENQTKFDASSKVTTEYYTRRFWQQNTDARDEEEGDITWQHTKSELVDYWTLFPKSISGLCDDINKQDEYVAPRWLNPNNPSSVITRHPGWVAKKIDKSYSVDPITGDRIYSIKLDPEYLNSDTGLATWIYGGGMLAVPSGKNSGSGTSYIKAIDISFNELKTILAQTIFHRINADFPPGKPDLFGNTSLRNEDGTVQESTLHLRGGFIARGPGYGLILPPQKSTVENLRKANLIEASTGTSKGSSESDSKGYFQTSSPFGKNKVDHYIELEKSTNFETPSNFRSSTRNFTQAKRERAAFKNKDGTEKSATNLTACESGFEKSIVIAYTVPSTKPGQENQTVIISTDSFFSKQYEKYPVGFNTVTGTGVSLSGEFPFLVSSETHINQAYRVNTFLFTERSSNSKSTNSHYYDNLISANTDMRNKFSWYPFIDGYAKTDANFSTLSKAFVGTKYNSYYITDQAPQVINVGYADPGAIIFRSISLNTTNINAPITDKVIFVDGIAPTYISDFRLLEPITSSGTAYSSFPTVAQLSSREYIVAYTMDKTPRTINFKIISNYRALSKNTLLDLDALTGNTLSDRYNIYGLSSDYDEKLRLFRSVFWCNGGIYYFEHPISSSSLGTKRSDKIHLIKGKLDENLVTELTNRRNIITYFNSDSDLNVEVPKQKPAIISCKKQEYDGKVLIAYDTGKCYIEAILFHPFTKIIGTRRFDIECVNTIDSTIQDTKPIADIQANPNSGQSALFVNFLSTNSYDPGGSTLSYAWNFGDETQSTEENPSHTFVNNTTSPIIFKVTLIVTNSSGISSDPASLLITVNPAPINNLSPQAKFSAAPTSGDVILTVTFTDQSNPANDGSFIQLYEWDFGDGESVIKFDNSPFTFDYRRTGSFTPTLSVKDNLARISSKFFGPTINVNGVSNSPPSPSFKWAQTSFFPTLKVQFTDTSSDDEGPLVAWNWNFGDNQTADVQNPEHIYADPGKYRVVLTVTDSGGLQVSGTIEITVAPPGNNPPIANFNYSQQNRKLVIDFTDTSADTDGTIVSWNWDFDDNSTSTIQNPSHTYFSAGRYLVTLRVSDNAGKLALITKEVIVNPLVNQAPIISNITGNQTSFKPLVVKFTEISSDPDGFITQWDWNFGDRNTFSTTDPTLKNPTNTYLFPGIYTVSLTVTDDGLPDGTNKKTATTSIRFTVAPPPANEPPVALFTVDSNNVLAPAKILFTDASTDADGKIVSWLWEFETGSTLFFNAQTYQKTVSHTFTRSGTFPVKLTVTDDGNLQNTYILDIVVKNNSPTAILTASPNPVLSKTQVNFFGNNSFDSDGNITKYAWNFGDGTIISQGRTTEFHTYEKPGTYDASLTVTDNIGDSSTANLLINVTNRNPVARITYTTLTVKAPGSLTFNGDTSTDEDGSIASYSWSVSNTVVTSTTNATINFTTQGTYIVSLTVTDDLGATNTTSISVNVTPADNILPIAVLSVDKNSGVINDTFVFDVSSSRDPDGSIILYRLDFGDGTSTQFVNSASISHIYKTVGVFTAKLIVTDNRTGVSLETANSIQVITINNQPPIASFSFSPVNAYTYNPITFTDNSSDPENALSRWSWNFGDETTFTTTDSLQKNPTKSFNDGNKDYTVSLTVYDNFELSSTTSQIIRINNRKPFAVIATSSTPRNNVITGISPFTVTFDSNSYDLDGTVVNYEWYINGLVGIPFTTKSFTYTFNSPRFTPYTVTLKVQDDDGDWSDVVNIGVKVNFPNIPPVAVISANPASNTSLAPVSVSFSAAGSYDPDNVGGPLIYAWDFGNGNVSDQVNAITTYNNPGTYKVSLTVTDNLAATNTATLDYIVKNSKPVALLDTVPTGITQVQINTSVTYTSQGSYDNDTNQFINGYKWLVDGINQNSNTPNLATSFSTIGNHVVTLSVFDNLGLESESVSKTIFVVSAPPPPPINKNPIAILGNEPTVSGYIEIKLGESFTFDGTSSYDPEDGSNITFEWSVDGVKSGYNSTFANQFNTVGIFTISLVVFDTQRLSSTPTTNLEKRYSVNVNVSAAPNPLANKLFSSGQAFYGSIASGLNTPDRYGFQLVDDTKQYTIIAAGLRHTLVVDVDGKLYASGSNANGQLGFSSSITQLNSLTLVPLASKYKVVKVSAGDFQSAIIAEDISINKRVLLVCGSNIGGIFGQSLPKTDIYNFQPIIERNITNNGASYTSSNSLQDISCNNQILAFIDNKQVWVAGLHNYTNKTGVVDNGFIPINIDPNPDLQIGSTNYLNPFKLSVGNASGINSLGGFVSGIGYDIDNQIVWFTGITRLRGWGYAYDISTNNGLINIISATQDQFDRSIVFYELYNNETPQFLGASQLVSSSFPGEYFVKISQGTSALLAISQNHFFAYGVNLNGCMGLPQSFNSSEQYNLQNNLPKYFISSNDSVIGAYDITTAGSHSIILASNVKPTGNNFTVIRPGGYPSVNNLTIYPTTQAAD
jgi:PKD repeat protein